MLDNETKRRIDTARNILVGKVPDPKSQVEQITIALIYKFMNDMDAVAEELGGSRTFFSEEFERYSWNNLMAPGMGGYDVLNLYAEAIQKMDFNPNIPTLFRDIFKNAFLPYRDPQTLKMFLKVINDFSYDHSEKLGDAFEYLLSVLGSQGDAGQFRTPRHIIDFMVEVVNPQKNDTILDPACGTAGFLISAYKYILKTNTKKGKTENTLTPDEQTTLAENIRGYDISPDMVRLSLVNLYLHGFQTPNIFEYDTLTSQDRWNEYADVILANPPFMSPKGGIRPHKRFSVQSKRSEVLFVDYMCEHLTPNGQAGIIVPEGIIFQSSNAYKQLREMLVKNYLYAVVSLPAGIFQPYAGVKTSILLIDKKLAKRTDKILFVKIENDGFGLGAQRRAIEKNDLPNAIDLIANYKQQISNGENPDIENFKNALLVEKNKIAESGDWNLSGERYRESFIANTEYDVVELGEIAEVISGQSPKGKYYNQIGEGTPFYQGKTEFGKMYIGEPKKWTTQVTKIAYKNDILMSVRAPVGPINFAIQECCIGRGLAAIRVNDNVINGYLFSLLRSKESEIKGGGGSVFDSINRKQIQQIKIPLPPLEIQKEIVAEIEGYQKIIDGAKAVVENYKPQIKIEPEWEMVEFDSVCTLEYGASLPKKNRVEGEYPVVGSNGITGWHNEYLIEAPAIVVGRKGSAGEVVYIDKHCFPIDTTYYVKTNTDNIDFIYLFFILKSMNLQDLKGGAGIPGLNRNDVYRTKKIPLPSLEIQKEIVNHIDKEQELVNANNDLIEIFEQKIKDRIARVWGE